MERLIDHLPGVPMSFSRVTETLQHMWEDQTGDPAGGIRASQMNVILHFGLQTEPAEARRLFDGLVAFAQIHPCRLILLCPLTPEDAPPQLEGKLFSQCFVGENLREMCCCEALALGYPAEQRNFLEDHVSLWLENDLPVYHWFHRVPPEQIHYKYRAFLQRSRKILFDSEIEGEAYGRLEIPEGSSGSDLVYARNLPFRQHIGQFLSQIEPAVLAEGLSEIEVRYSGKRERAALDLCRWQQGAVVGCGLEKGVFRVRVHADDSLEDGFHIRWNYSSEKEFLWEYSFPGQTGRIQFQAETFRIDHAQHIEPLPMHHVIAEALFFGREAIA